MKYISKYIHQYVLTVINVISLMLVFQYSQFSMGEKIEHREHPVTAIQEAENLPLTYRVLVTAYSSTPEETDSTPFITASMSSVRYGIIAANFLPFGTKIKIPELFGDEVFTVEDRMHPRKKDNFVDVWMPEKQKALEFGIHEADVIVLD